MSYMVDKPPTEDKIMQRQLRAWEPKEHRPTLTWSRSGFKTYSTYVEEFWICWRVLTGSLGPRPSTSRGFRLLRRASKRRKAFFHYSLEVYITPIQTGFSVPVKGSWLNVPKAVRLVCGGPQKRIERKSLAHLFRHLKSSRANQHLNLRGAKLIASSD